MMIRFICSFILMMGSLGMNEYVRRNYLFSIFIFSLYLGYTFVLGGVIFLVLFKIHSFVSSLFFYLFLLSGLLFVYSRGIKRFSNTDLYPIKSVRIGAIVLVLLFSVGAIFVIWL